jgi:hypothetical protein
VRYQVDRINEFLGGMASGLILGTCAGMAVMASIATKELDKANAVTAQYAACDYIVPSIEQGPDNWKEIKATPDNLHWCFTTKRKG